MNLTPQPDGSVHLTEGPDRLVFSRSAFEDLCCALPLENGWLFTFLNESILEESAERDALARIVATAGGVEAAMGSLQMLVRDSARPAAPAPAAAPAKPTAVGILLVESDDWNARSLEEGIRGSSFTLAGRVRRIDEGLDHYRKSHAALVVLNLATPGAGEETIGGGLDPVRRFLDIDPACRLLVTYTMQTKSLVLAAIRAGANGHLLLPAKPKDLLAALDKSLTARANAPAPRGIVVKRTLVCEWKPDSAGLLTGWTEFLARSIDLKGADGPLNTKLKEGETGRLRIQLPGDGKPVEVSAIVASLKWDSAVRTGTVRFQYRQLSVDVLARISRFLAAEQAKAPPHKR